MKKIFSVLFSCLLYINSYASNSKPSIILVHKNAWLKEEHQEKNIILEAFWNERIIQYNQKSVDGFKNFIINSHYPKDAVFKNKMNELFQNAVSQKIEYPVFYASLKDLSLSHFRIMNQTEHLIPEKEFEDIQPDIKKSDLENIKYYIKNKNLSVSFTLGSAKDKLITPNYPENLSPYPFAIHSIGKVFTGVLTILMIRDGIISEDDLNKPVKLDKWVEQQLPLSAQEQLKKVTLHQLMTHQAGLDDYLGNYIRAVDSGNIPTIKQAEDFVPFIEAKTYPIGEEHYSNAGILLLGLAAKHAYEITFKKTVNYDDLLQEYILKKAGITSFSPWKPKNAKYNLNDPIAPYIVGSPGGGYWMTASDLAKFGKWVYQKMILDPEFKRLIEKYGQEFYHDDRQVIEHGGAIPSSSGFLSISLKTGSMIALLSDQPGVISSDLKLMIQEHIFSKKLPDKELTIQYGI